MTLAHAYLKTVKTIGRASLQKVGPTFKVARLALNHIARDHESGEEQKWLSDHKD
jgi:hypothetical protein